ncbi:LysR family transcriptional regulator, partial [Marivita geojedonensis]
QQKISKDTRGIILEIDWKTLPSLASLRAFELTARRGNFASAARDLNVTHAAIAQRVRSLEAEVGVPLARRSGRTVVLTEAGARLAQHLNEGFGTIAAGIRELQDDQSKIPLQIAATMYISQAVILPKLHEFWQLHPAIQVSVMPSQNVVDIVALGFDLAIRATPNERNWAGLDAELLLESELIAVGAPSLVGDDITSLHHLPWIWSPGMQYEEDAMKALGLDPQRLRNVDVGAPFLQLSLARQGLGLWLTAEVLVRDDLASGDLRRVPVPSPFSMKYYAATPVGPVRPHARTFINWLKAALTKQE